MAASSRHMLSNPTQSFSARIRAALANIGLRRTQDLAPLEQALKGKVATTFPAPDQFRDSLESKLRVAALNKRQHITYDYRQESRGVLARSLITGSALLVIAFFIIRAIEKHTSES